MKKIVLFVLLLSFSMLIFHANAYFIPEDMNEDGIVNIQDLQILGKCFGSRPGDPRWNPEIDVYPPGCGDNYINIFDALWLALKFGTTE